MGVHHDAALATAALQVAVAVRGGDVAGVLFHSDQGGEYTGDLFTAACRGARVVGVQADVRFRVRLAVRSWSYPERSCRLPSVLVVLVAPSRLRAEVGPGVAGGWVVGVREMLVGH